MGNLHFTATIDAASFNKTLNDIEKRIKGIHEEAGKGVPWFNVSNLSDGYATIQALGEIAAGIIKVRTEAQQLETSFTALLKSKSEANALMGEILKTAAETPFSMKEIGDGAKKLLAYGENSQFVIANIKMLGEVATGVATPISELIELYATLKNTGQASDESLESLAAKGVPIYHELGKVLNVDINRVKELAEAGRVSFNDMQQAFTNMTQNGGIFHGMMAQQSQSIIGLIGNFQDALDRMFIEIGQTQEGTIAGIVKGATFVIDNYEEVIKVLQILLATYGAYKAAIIVTTAIQNRANIASSVSAFISLAKSIKTAADAQAFFNLVTGLNPYAIIATAILAAATAVVVYADSTSAAEQAQKDLNEMEKIATRQKEVLTQATNDLIGSIKSETTTRFQQLAAFQKLKELYPSLYKEMDIDTYKKKDAIEAQKELNKVLDEISIAEAEDNYRKAGLAVENLQEQLKMFDEQIEQGIEIDPFSYIRLNKSLEEANIELESLKKKAEQLRELFYKANTPPEEQLKTLMQTKAALEAQKKALEGTLLPFVSANKEANLLDEILRNLTVQNLINEIGKVGVDLEELKKKMGAETVDFAVKLSDATNTKDVKGLISLQALAVSENKIKALSKAVEQVKGDLNLNSTEFKQLDAFLKRLNAKGKGEAPAPFGTLEYWQTISKRATELLNKINPFAKGKEQEIARYQAQKINAEKKAEAVSKVIAIKSFEEIFDEKRKQYELYEQWVKLKGQESADVQFADLKKSGESYQAYLKSQINSLEAQIGSDKADDKDKANLIMLKNESIKVFSDELEKKKGLFEQYNRWALAYGMDSADKQFSNLLKQGNDYKTYLENQIDLLETRIKAGTATPEEKENLITLKTRLDVDTQALDTYKEGIVEISEQFTSLTEKIEYFQNEQDKISPLDKERTLFLVEQRLETEKQRKEALKSFLIDTNTNETKRLEITKRYIDLRMQVEKEFADKKSEAYRNAIEKIDFSERGDIEKLDNKLKTSIAKTQQELSAILNTYAEKDIQNFIDTTASKLQELYKIRQSGKELTETESQAYISLTIAISQAKQQLSSLNISKYQTLLGLLSEIGTEFRDLDGTLGNIGRSLSEAANKGLEFLNIAKLGNISKDAETAAKSLKLLADNQPTPENIKAAEDAMLAFKDATKGTEQAVFKLSEMIIKEVVKSWVQQKKMNDELYRNKINLQRQYNNLLIEEMRINTLKNEGFVKNYKGVIADALAAGTAAQNRLNDIFNTLDKTLGVIIKRHGGFFGIGAFDDLAPIMKLHPDLVSTDVLTGVKTLNIELAELLINSGTLSKEASDLLRNGIDLQKIANDASKQISDVIDDLVGDIGGVLQNALVDAFHSGIDAAEAFRKVVGDVIADVSAKLLFSAIFQQAFDELGIDFKKSFDKGGDLNIADDLDRWFTKYQGLTKIFQQGQKDLEKWLKDNGYNVTNSASTGNKNSLSGSIQTITQETAGVLEGQINAVRITQSLNLDINRNILLGISKIAVNSDYLKHLENIAKDIKDIKNGDSGLRSGGL